MRPIIRVGAWHGFVETVLTLGGDPAPILSSVGLDLETLNFSIVFVRYGR